MKLMLSQRANPHVPLLGPLNLLGRSWMRSLIVLLLQTILYLPHQLCRPIAVLGHGFNDEQIPSQASILILRLQVEFQPWTLECKGACFDCRCLLGKCK